MTSSTTAATASAESKAGTRRRRALAVPAAIVAALLVWLIAGLTGTETVPPGAIVVVTLVVSLLGWATLAVLERLTRHARVAWIALALVVLIASFGPALVVPPDVATRVALVIMHAAVAAALIPGMAGLRRKGQDNPA